MAGTGLEPMEDMGMAGTGLEEEAPMGGEDRSEPMEHMGMAGAESEDRRVESVAGSESEAGAEADAVVESVAGASLSNKLILHLMNMPP